MVTAEPTTDWQLPVTDLSGLPATARIIEELPRGVPVTAVSRWPTATT